MWTEPAETDANVAWTRETYGALEPYRGDGRWLNYFGDDEDADARRRGLRPQLRPAARGQAALHPDNVFRLNQNIVPA